MRIGIFGGAGEIGSSCAYGLIASRLAEEIVICDVRQGLARAHVMDFEQMVGSDRDGSRVRLGTLVDLVTVDILLVCASVPHAWSSDPEMYLRGNLNIVEQLVPLLNDERWCGTVVVLTNPVDVVCSYLSRRTGIDRSRLFGYTFNDSRRFRS